MPPSPGGVEGGPAKVLAGGSFAVRFANDGGWLSWATTAKTATKCFKYRLLHAAGENGDMGTIRKSLLVVAATRLCPPARPNS